MKRITILILIITMALISTAQKKPQSKPAIRDSVVSVADRKKAIQAEIENIQKWANEQVLVRKGALMELENHTEDSIKVKVQ
jgi:hypothetical protein